MRETREEERQERRREKRGSEKREALARAHHTHMQANPCSSTMTTPYRIICGNLFSPLCLSPPASARWSMMGLTFALTVPALALP